MISAEQLVENLAAVRHRVDEAARSAGRRPADVRIIGVTKTHAPELARAAVVAGLPDLAENRVQEWRAKAPLVPGARWHLVGQLQRNKVRHVVGQHVLVHTVDRRSLVDALSQRAQLLGVLQRALVQVNVGDDPAKGGCAVNETLDLVAYARHRAHLAVEGLMTMPPMPPPGRDPVVAARPHFATLRGLRDEVQSRFPEVVHLSMGMSDDLEAAVEQGATMVRIGTALFGARGQGPWSPSQEER